MNSFSGKLLIFVPSTIRGGRHRGELQSFNPSENLDNSSAWVRRLKAVPPVVNIINLSCVGCQHIPTGVSRFSFFHAQVVQNLLTKNAKKAHTLCVFYQYLNSNKIITINV